MKALLLSLFLICFAAIGFSQKNSDIKARLIDSTKQPLVGASAILYFQKDSLLTGYGLTDEQGEFVIPKVAPGEYYLQINYVGYLVVNKSLSKDQFNGTVDLGTIELKQNTDLEAVVVTNAPLEVRKDTIIYDADAFKTKENATVEDLLKKLPGIEVDDDGTITAQGEEVQNVLVDGKKFFGDDPKIVTKNLPAEAVKNVEVYDKKSEKAEFTGVDDGEEEKTVNLELREDYKKGWFGNVRAGGGVDQDSEALYNGKALVNRFNPQNQLSFIAATNNTNESTFSYRDYFTMTGQSFGPGKTITTSNSTLNIGTNPSSGVSTNNLLGTNWNRNFGDEVEVHADYYFNQIVNRLNQSVHREYFQNSNNIIYDLLSDGKNTNGNHRLTSDVTWKPNKKNEWKLESEFVFAKNDSDSNSESETLSQSGELENKNKEIQQNDGNNFGANLNVYWKHRFKKQGRSIFFKAGYNNTATDYDQYTLASTNFYLSNENNTLDQLLASNYGIDTWSGGMSYTEPLNNSQYVELNYNLSNDAELRDQNYFDLSTGSEVFDPNLSNEFHRDYISNTGNISYKIMKEKFKLSVIMGFQAAMLNGVTSSSSQEIKRNFNQFQPSFNFSYDFTESKHFSLFGNTRLSPPSVIQLQPAIDNTNPLNLYQGNPDLDAEKNYTSGVNYFSFNRFSFTHFSVNSYINYQKDNIVTSQYFDENRVQTTTPVNVDYNWSWNNNVHFGTAIRPIRSRIRTSYSGTLNQGQLFLNSIINDFDRWNNTVRFFIENTNTEKFNIELSASWNYSNQRYSENEARNQDFFNQRYRTSFEYDGIEHWEFNTDFNYRIYELGEGLESQKLPLWGASISRNFANNLGNVELRVSDILNRNQGIQQSQNLNYLEEQLYNAIGRNGMLRLSWKIMEKKKKEEQTEVGEHPVSKPAKPSKPPKPAQNNDTHDSPVSPPPPPPPN